MNFRKRLFKHLLFLFLLSPFSYSSFAQDRNEKTLFIINKLLLVEAQQSQYTAMLEYLKMTSDGNDSVTIVEIENKLTEPEITKRIISGMDTFLTEEEINIIYAFLQTSVFDKLMSYEYDQEVLIKPFENIKYEIDSLRSKQFQRESLSENIFSPIPIDRVNGFYETENYDPTQDEKTIQLKKEPGVTFEDILVLEKEYNYVNNNNEIRITFTENGKHKFQVLTKNNIKKPIAIVIDKHIVSMPIVNEEISGGKLSISGDFSEAEIDAMIESLRGKK